MNLKSLSPRHRQYLLAAGVASLSTLIVGALILKIFEEEEFPESLPQPFSQETNVSSVGRRVNNQAVWVEKMEEESKKLGGRLAELEKLYTDSLGHLEEKSQEMESLRQELETLKNVPPKKFPGKGCPYREEGGSQNAFGSESIANGSYLQEGAFFPGMEEEITPKTPEKIKKFTLKLKSKTPSKKGKTIENTIPAGAYAKAIFLGGVDASTAIHSQSDPRPVLLRITDTGNLPRRFKSDLKGCHVLASSYGDLSSERVYMRLEKLTCTEILTGEIIETQVAGYITGEDGRAGVRGIVVDRAGEAVRNTFIAGFLGGVSQFFAADQQRAVFPVSPFGQTNALSTEKMLGSSAGKGGADAMNKLADFYIKRAEQLQPVIQIAAGRMVDIVFTQGTEFGDTSVKKTLHQIREDSRKDAISSLQKQGDTKNWMPKMEDM